MNVYIQRPRMRGIEDYALSPTFQRNRAPSSSRINGDGISRYLQRVITTPQITRYYIADEHSLYFTAVKALNLKFILAANRGFVRIYRTVENVIHSAAR
jgi:hypothetical protein